MSGETEDGMRSIRQLREERGWTQLELAYRLGVTPVTIYNWERGRTEPRVSQTRPQAPQVLTMAEAPSPARDGSGVSGTGRVHSR